MRSIFVLWLLILWNSVCAQQNIKDDIYVAYLVNQPNDDLKYDSCEEMSLEQKFASLRNSGEYIVSIIRTKENLLVFYHTNTKSIEQQFIVICDENLKSICNQYFDVGYAIAYYNNENGYAIFDKSVDVTRQEVVTKLNQKILEKYNAKGLYLVAGGNETYILQNGHDGILRQYIEKYPSIYRLQCDSFFTRTNHNCVPVFLTKSYNYSDDSTAYTIVYNEYNYPYRGKQFVKEFRTEKQLSDYLQSQQFQYGYRLCKLWGGWTPRTYSGTQHASLGISD
jgi:hypothetical protein